MKSWATVLVIMVLGVSVMTCFDPPEFPAEPEIQFKDVYFGDNPLEGSTDSIVLSISFTDGDGDLGLNSGEEGCTSEGICYNRRFYFVEGTNERLTSDQTAQKLVTFKSKRTIPGYDTLPEISCLNYEQIKEGLIVKDTIYFQLNSDHYNIFVDFLIKQADGSFRVYDWNSEFPFPGCVDGYNGRFPILFKETPGSPLEGVINYALKSSAFNIIFSTRTLKLRVYIKDRALNRSNVIETPEFTLQQIRR
jgi:hypothetical protein